MRTLKFKPENSGLVRKPWPPFETSQFLLTRGDDRLISLGDVKAAPTAIKPMLMLEKLAGVVLGGTAVTALVLNPLVCIYTLLLGSTSIIELLVEMNGLNI